MRRTPIGSFVLATLLATATWSGAAAQETLLQNDGFVDGQSIAFQGGFVAQEIAASRLLPVGTAPWRVNRVQFLFGGATSTETITLHIWNDAAGTGVPGTELFVGDFDVTGSNTLMQEIDLTSSNVLVTGQFRVGIEFQHSGTPSVARDGDGTIQASRNFIYTPSVPGWFQSSLFGLTGDWIIRAWVEEVPAGGGNAPDILTVADVGNDQGKQVRVRFARSAQDQSGATTPVLAYEVLRRDDPLPTATASRRAPLEGRRPFAFGTGGATASRRPPASIALDGWDYVTSVPAHGDAIYSVVVPSLADSSVANGLHWSVFMIRATTAAPLTFYDSGPDSGYSVDNLPPVPPAAFVAAYSGGATNLEWAANEEPDLWYYTLHRGTSAGFLPGAGNRIATLGGVEYADVGPAGSYYKLAAVDVNGNVSGYSLVTPGATAGVGEEWGASFSLANAGPNPSRNGRVMLSLMLPAEAPARLEMLDLGGRRVASREVGSLGPGRHTLDLPADRELAPGIYVVRLSQGNARRAIRVVLTR